MECEPVPIYSTDGRMGTRRILTFLLLCLMLPAVAGCGSGSSSGGSFGEAAKAFPSGSLAYVDVNIDPNSAAGTKIESLAVVTTLPA